MIENDAVKTLSEQWPVVAVIVSAAAALITFLVRTIISNHKDERESWKESLDRVVRGSEDSLKALGATIADEMKRNRESSEKTIEALLKRK